MLGSLSFATLLLYAIGAIGLLFLLVVGLKRPWFATVAAIASIAFVPFWTGVSVSVFFVSVHMVLLGLALVSIFFSDNARPRLHVVDLVLVGVFLLTCALVAVGMTSLAQAYTFFQWMLAYVFARYAAAAFGIPRLSSVFAVVFAIAGALLVVEFVTGRNFWTEYLGANNALYQIWGTLQSRGGVLRAEGAFGHSIAAGCSLALAAILTLDAKLKPWLRITAIGIMVAGILTTISRTGIVTVALGLGLAIVFARLSLSRLTKVLVLGVLAAGAVIYATALQGIFSDAGDEASNSASYRLWLFDLLPYLQPFGVTASATRSTAGTLSFGSFGSIDNAVLGQALTTGWVPTLILLGLAVAAAIKVLGLRASVPMVAVAATIPALFTVALITQYSLVFWIVAGLAVSGTRSAPSPEQPDPVETSATSRTVLAGAAQ